MFYIDLAIIFSFFHKLINDIIEQKNKQINMFSTIL